MKATPMRALAYLVLASTLATLAVPAWALGGTPLERALHYLEQDQRSDGTFAGVGAPYVVEAIAQAGRDAKAWPTLPLNAYATLAPSQLSDSAARYKADLRTLHAAATTGYDPHAVHGADLVALARAGYNAGQFGDPTTINDDTFAILALRAAGVPPDDAQIQSSATIVANAQNADGGWSWTPHAAASDVDDTGIALAALRAAGHALSPNARASALDFLNTMRDDANGGYRSNAPTLPTQAPLPTNVQSTVWALHARALLDAPEDERSAAWILSLQRDDGGFPRFANDTAGANAWATSEVALWLTGRHYPLPSYAPGTLDIGDVHALEPKTLRILGTYTTVNWTLDGAPATMPLTFTTPGTHEFSLLAERVDARWRTNGTILVRSARPIVTAPAQLDALRHVPMTLDLAGSFDPDGVITGARIDWGDGNVTTDAATPHAYDLPGDRVVRARVVDDAGEWSDTAQVNVHVRDRAPLFDAALPARIVADRAHDAAIAPAASDPDDEPVDVSWTWNGTSGAGAFRTRPTQLGETNVTFTATDPYGATTNATVVLDVRNLPPSLANVTLPTNATANRTLQLRADATDADGPAPTLTWRVGNATLSGAAADLALAAGAYEVTVEARDADGAVVRASGTVVVRDEGALAGGGSISTGTRAPVDIKSDDRAAADPAPTAPSALPTLSFDSAPATARVGEPARFVLVPLAEATEYRFAFGDESADQEGNDSVGVHAWTRAGAFEVRATARAADGRESVATTLVEVRAVPSRAAPNATRGAPLERTTVNASSEGTATRAAAPPANGSRPGIPAAAAPPRRESPALLPLAPLLLAALGARRGRGGRTARR